jgi:hypothetical protein
MIKNTRRTFCNQTAAATTGILASTLPLDAMSNVYDNKKLKLALIGCGGRGSGAAVWLQNVLLVFFIMTYGLKVFSI